MNDIKTTPSLEVQKGSLYLELSKLGYNYQKVLQSAEDIEFAKDNLQQDYEPLALLRKMSTAVDKFENPFTPSWKAWNEAKKSLVDPIKDALKRKTDQYTKFANELRIEQEQQKSEKERIDKIKQSITDKKAELGTRIASCTKPEELVAIEKEIGSEGLRTNTYKEYIEELKTALSELKPLIKDQKEAIKTLAGLEEKEKTAEGEHLEEILNQKDEVTSKIFNQATQIQEKALTASPVVETYVPESVSYVPKPRRQQWKIKMIDVDKALKSQRHLLEITLDTSLANDVLEEGKKIAMAQKKEKIQIDGLLIYLDKTY